VPPRERKVVMNIKDVTDSINDEFLFGKNIPADPNLVRKLISITKR
jgi:hypothetical protein